MKNKALLIGLLVVGCSNASTPIVKSATDVDFVTKYEEASAGVHKVGKPYEIKGETYTPGFQPTYDQEGVASWYGPGFHGRKTASGEIFDTNALTAAHPTLPIPSVVEVTNLENGQTITVKINDRGPFASDRIIDLSEAAAEKLDMVRTGTAHVRVKLLQEETLAYLEYFGG